MSRTIYIMTVLGCAICWFLVGLHVPALHNFTHHDAPLPLGFLSLIMVFLAIAVAETWALLRAPVPIVARTTSPPPSSAT